MAFRNSILAGEELVRSGIRSENYVAGVSGWRIGRDGSAEFLDATVRGSLIVGVGDPRIEVVPDHAGLGPAIVFYPDGGGPPTLLVQIGGTAFAIRSPDGLNSLLVTDGGIALLVDQLAQLAIDTNDIAVTGASGGVPGATLNGALFDLFRLTEYFVTAPGGNIDVTAAAFAAWSPTIAVTPPPWCSRAEVVWNATAIDVTGAGVWDIRPVLGGVAGRAVHTVPNGMQSYPGIATFAGLAGGVATTIEIQGRRTAGPNALRASVDSDFGYQITWLP